jgi:hypothetical protein
VSITVEEDKHNQLANLCSSESTKDCVLWPDDSNSNMGPSRHALCRQIEELAKWATDALQGQVTTIMVYMRETLECVGCFVSYVQCGHQEGMNHMLVAS